MFWAIYIPQKPETGENLSTTTKAQDTENIMWEWRFSAYLKGHILHAFNINFP
jgi:hypothetical protein